MQQQGMGLMEVLVALVVASLGFLALLRMEITAYRYLQHISQVSAQQQREGNRAEAAYAVR